MTRMRLEYFRIVAFSPPLEILISRNVIIRHVLSNRNLVSLCVMFIFGHSKTRQHSYHSDSLIHAQPHFDTHRFGHHNADSNILQYDQSPRAKSLLCITSSNDFIPEAYSTQPSILLPPFPSRHLYSRTSHSRTSFSRIPSRLCDTLSFQGYCS